MKSAVHPKINVTEVSCSCGNQFTMDSTYSKPTLKLDVCNRCHPFFTGKQRVLDTGGRVERFKKRFSVL